jgi:hypothetical protein
VRQFVRHKLRARSVLNLVVKGSDGHEPGREEAPTA